MKFLFIWTGITSYMVACWRELASRPGVSVKIVLEISESARAVAEEMLEGMDYTLCIKGEAVQKVAMRSAIMDFAPDLMVVVGWRAKISRFATLDRSFKEIHKLFTFDMIFEWKLRKFLAPFVLHSYLRHFDHVLVPGDRTAFYAKFLGFRSSQIHHGMLAIDVARYAAAYERRSQLTLYPRSFTFAGRYAKVKRIDMLVEAYTIYRSRVVNPWTLNCYGTGEFSELLHGIDGLVDHGYTSPQKMLDVYANTGAFVLTSEYDPWPLVIAESVASGLPVVCTEACGSHADLIRSHYNGVVCGTNDPESIADGMVWVHENEDRLLEIGQQGMSLVAPYSKEQWGENFLAVAKKFV